MRVLLPILLFMAALAGLLVWPVADLIVSSWFYWPRWGFIWQNFWALQALTSVAYYGARIMGAVCLTAGVLAYWRHRTVLKLPGRAWVFLFMALVIGPGLVANGIFKDHWGRARPREVAQFGGRAAFTPPLIVTNQCQNNCSFVAGDGAFGFFLPSFAYVVPPKRSRRTFWGLMGVGSMFGAARILMGAHFLSDVMYAAFFILAVSAGLFGVLYGWDKLVLSWRRWFWDEPKRRW